MKKDGKKGRNEEKGERNKEEMKERRRLREK